MITVVNLSKRRGSGLVVDNLTFEVRPGIVTGLVGLNGSGKSTTLRMILGLERPDAGQALIGGRRYGELADPLRAVGAALDAGRVHPRRSGRDHLRWLARAGGLSASGVDEYWSSSG